jgi:hypothetical protein
MLEVLNVIWYQQWADQFIRGSHVTSRYPPHPSQAKSGARSDAAEILGSLPAIASARTVT